MTPRRTVATAERIEEFCDKLAARKNRVREIRALCLGERNFLKNALYVKRGVAAERENATTLSIPRRHNLIVQYRNAIRARFGDEHPALKYMVLSEQDQEARNAASREMVVARVNERRPIDADALVAKALQTLASVTGGAPSPFELAAALMVVTGRRSIEVFQTAVFSQPKPEDAAQLFDSSIRAPKRFAFMFAGQAKTRGAENAHNTPYAIPLLAPPDVIAIAFAWLRQHYDVQGLTTEKVHDRVAKPLGKYAKAAFGLKPSELRAAYATIAYEWYAPEKHSWNAYTARILGHSVNDLVTSFSYDQFYPIGSKRDYARDIRNATKETLEMLRTARFKETDETKAAFLDDKIAAVETRLEAAK